MKNHVPQKREHKLRVMFLCVHNSARSQMAEALLREMAGAGFEVESAGFEPRPVLAKAVEAMRLAGIDISRANSKSVFDLFREGRIFDYVITVCDAATAERCPIFPGVCERLYWTFADPSEAQGTDKERLAVAIAVRDEIRSCIEQWLKELRARGTRGPRLRSAPKDN